jgi:hypothetical protein
VLSVIYDVKEKCAEIKKLYETVEASNEEIKLSTHQYTTTRPQGQAGAQNAQWTINRNLIQIIDQTYNTVKKDILPALSDRLTLLKSKLEQFTVRKMIGSGRSHQMLNRR